MIQLSKTSISSKGISNKEKYYLISIKDLGRKTHVSELVVDEEVLFWLRDVSSLPAREPGPEGISYGGSGSRAVDKDEAEETARMGETAPGEDVRTGAFSETDGVLHVQEVQHGYEVFAEGLERWEWVAEIETLLLNDW